VRTGTRSADHGGPARCCTSSGGVVYRSRLPRRLAVPREPVHMRSLAVSMNARSARGIVLAFTAHAAGILAVSVA
jgi:hypothetical protein